jgi:hypothetical protein
MASMVSKYLVTTTPKKPPPLEILSNGNQITYSLIISPKNHLSMAFCDENVNLEKVSMA